jgi:hypothetical protein
VSYFLPRQSERGAAAPGRGTVQLFFPAGMRAFTSEALRWLGFLSVFSAVQLPGKSKLSGRLFLGEIRRFISFQISVKIVAKRD